MEKHFPVRASLKVGSWLFIGIFTFAMTLNYFSGPYRFWSAVYLGSTTGVVAGVYTYWRLWRKPADENGKVKVGKEDLVLRTVPLFVPGINARHPILAPTIRTGLYLSCALFTWFTVLSHFAGAPNFQRAFVAAAIAGVIGLFEGYRRALDKHNGNSEHAQVTS